MQRAARLRQEVEEWRSLLQRISDASELAELDDETMRLELEHELNELSGSVEKLEFVTMLSGEYDRDDAILGIHAGTGGVDAMDWAAMLERMYLRWAEEQGYKAEILDRSLGEETG